MGKLVIRHDLVTPEKAAALVEICPFNAISFENGRVDISSGCKMCKMCVRKGQGLVEFEEDAKTVDKSAWKGICVYADCTGGNIHRVTFELIGKAKELAAVTGHSVYALVIGHQVNACAEKLLHYGVDKVFVYDHPAFANFRIEPYTAACCDFIEKEKPSAAKSSTDSVFEPITETVPIH